MLINENDREALGQLAQYVVHASFSMEKIRYVEKTGCVMYKSSPAELRSPPQGGIRALVRQAKLAQATWFKSGTGKA